MPTSSEGRRWTLVRREAGLGRKAGRWRVDYDGERLWGFEYEVVVPASEVERLTEALREAEAALGYMAPWALGPHEREVRNAAILKARAALHPDEPKEE